MDDNSDLQRRVEELEKWKEQITTQQITFPLDAQSQKILNTYFLSRVSNLDFTNASGNVLPNLIIQQNGHQWVVAVQENLIIYTVNVGTNVLTLGHNITTGAQGTFANNDQVILNSTGDLPAPLVDNVPYYVVNSTGTTIKLSLTLGGSAIDITNAGTGTQYIQFFN